MADAAPVLKSPIERQMERQRFALAVVGRKALDFAHLRGFPDWDAFQAFLEEAFPASDKPPAPAPPAGTDMEEGAGAPPAPPGSVPAKGAKPAAKPGPPPTFDKAARAAMEANGVDEQLLVTFLFGESGPARKVTAVDVERYLNA
jgi:hypothetical protein